MKPSGGTRSRGVVRARVAAFLIAAALLAVTSSSVAVAASTVTVTTTRASAPGSCTLADAIAYANGTSEPACATAPASGTTTILLPASEFAYRIPATLTLTGDAVIEGAGTATTTIDGGGVQVFNLSSGAVATIAGVTITGGVSGDGAASCGVAPCPAANGRPGGGIANAGMLTLSNVSVTANAASDGTQAVPAPCPSGCAGQAGGGGGDGGGIYNTGALTITGSTISGNTAGTGGNGTNGISGPTSAKGGGIGGGAGLGGGIYNSGTLTLNGSTIAGNSAGAGGSGGSGSSSPAGDGGGGAGGGSGGGIFNLGTLTLTNSTLAVNSTGSGGRGGTGAVTGAGASGGAGGALGAAGGTALLANDTIVENATAAGGGGAGGGSGAGIAQSGSATFALHFVTVAQNDAAGSDGGLDGTPGTISEADSIVASNSPTNCSAEITDGGGDLVFGDSSCPGSLGDPRLGPLSGNGGPTQTSALGPGSAAIGLVGAAACSETTDQRGVSRPASSCDAGSYQLATPTITSAAAAAATSTTATVTALVNPNLRDTTVFVRYGATTSYGTTTATQDIGAGNGAVPISVTLTGLAAGSADHAEVVASNGDGTTTSTDLAFTTRAPPQPLALSILSSSTSGAQLSLRLRCSGGVPGNVCQETLGLASHVTTRRSEPVAVSATKRVTKDESVGEQSVSVATGDTRSVLIGLNHTGRQLLAQFYKLPALLSASGTLTQSQKVLFSYPVIRAAVSFTAAFDPRSTTFEQLSVNHVPAGAKVTMLCDGGGCSFAKHIAAVHHGKANLLSELGHSKLSPRAKLSIEITADNEVGKDSVFTIRSGAAPSLSVKCLVPGAGGPSRCV